MIDLQTAFMALVILETKEGKKIGVTRKFRRTCANKIMMNHVDRLIREEGRGRDMM